MKSPLARGWRGTAAHRGVRGRIQPISRRSRLRRRASPRWPHAYCPRPVAAALSSTGECGPWIRRSATTTPASRTAGRRSPRHALAQKPGRPLSFPRSPLVMFRGELARPGGPARGRSQSVASDGSRDVRISGGRWRPEVVELPGHTTRPERIKCTAAIPSRKSRTAPQTASASHTRDPLSGTEFDRTPPYGSIMSKCGLRKGFAEEAPGEDA